MPDETTPTPQSPVVAETTKTAVKANLKAAGIEVRAIWPEAQDGLMLLHRDDLHQVRLIPANQWDGSRRFEIAHDDWNKLAVPDLDGVIEKAKLTAPDLVYAFARSGIISPDTFTPERAKHAGQRLLYTISAAAE